VFRRLLVANRGEIAVRVIRTCQRLGIETVAVYSDADRDAVHTALADRAVSIGESRATESYLRIDKIVDAAQRSGAEAIHPGYGFLSENGWLAEACADAGIGFVGPSAQAIHSMGSKAEARRIAREHGVPCVPGYDGENQSLELLIDAAQEIGFPVMIKASAGGGGRGIRIVENEAVFEKAAAAARREAEAAFDDGRLIVERYVRAPRHVEVQVVGDRHGNLVHCFERECSVQRRHQKVIEEAPAPRLSDAQRARLHADAVSLARAIGYDNAGTVEFVLDDESGETYFLEMNTRLQVEHPTTELVTGLDLVELQLRAAAGEPLPVGQDDIRLDGWSIEVRVNAEDPAKKFLPRTGVIEHLRWPEAEGLRVDTGVRSGSEISPFYDSLIAKLVTHGGTRDQAIARMVDAIDRTECFGPANNLGFLRQLVDSAAFRSGELTTHFLERHFPKGPAAPAEALPIPLYAVAALVLAGESERGESGEGSPGSPWQQLGSWRLLDGAGAPASSHWFLEQGKRIHPVRVVADGTLDWGEGLRAARVVDRGDGRVELECDGAFHALRVARLSDRIGLVHGGERSELRAIPREQAWRSAAAGHGVAGRALAAPFPGQIAEVRVEPGDRVAEGDVLIVLEAMKMLHNLAASGSAVVSEVCCGVGSAVGSGDVLVRFESENPAEPQTPGRAES
jgi:3-methylcrotonyl-CoA carboxylase alpha subunit